MYNGTKIEMREMVLSLNYFLQVAKWAFLPQNQTKGVHMEGGQDLVPALQMLQKIMLSSPVCYSFWTKSGGVFITSIEQFTYFSVVRHCAPQTNRDDWVVWKSAAEILSRYISVQHVLSLLSENICTSKTFFGAGKM